MEPNLIAAQKVDPTIVEIIASAPSVAIYGYSDVKKTWVKSEHEGALLICRRNAQPPYSFIILNQLKPQNFTQSLDSNVSLQRKSEYLLYKPPGADSVRAVWFYNESDCIRIFDIIKSAVEKARTEGQMPQQPSLAPAVSASSRQMSKGAVAEDAKLGKDILSMLSTAHKQAQQRGQIPDSGKPGQIARTGVVGAAGDSRPSIPLENLFKDAARNGSSNVPSQKPNPLEEVGKDRSALANMTGVNVNVSHLSAMGKGRGRVFPDGSHESSWSSQSGPASQVVASETQAMAPVLQRLLTGPSHAGGDLQQHPVPSAFTSVAPRQNQKMNLNGGNASIESLTSDLLVNSSGARMVSPLMASHFSPIGSGGNMIQDELLTPADLGAGAIYGSDASAMNRAMSNSAGLPFASHMPVDQSRVQGIPPQNKNLVVEQSVGHPELTVEQFRQHFLSLLENDRDFVQRLYDAFTNESTRRGGSNFGSGGTVDGYRKY